MSDEKRTILEMLAEGKITQEQADQLLDALGGAEETETEPEAEPGEPIVINSAENGQINLTLHPDHAEANAELPKEVTPSGITTSVIVWFPANARLLTDVTPSGTATFSASPWYLIRMPLIIANSPRFFIHGVPENVDEPTHVTLWGLLTCVRLAQFSNANSLI